jgi:hypothetical protein
LAILAAEAEGINVLFSDITMPGDMTGRELAAEVARLYPRIRQASSPDTSRRYTAPELLEMPIRGEFPCYGNLIQKKA